VFEKLALQKLVVTHISVIKNSHKLFYFLCLVIQMQLYSVLFCENKFKVDLKL
jgi:hypothetical protein